jgi:hypothetical protein
VVQTAIQENVGIVLVNEETSFGNCEHDAGRREKKKTKQQGERVLVLDSGRELERIYAGLIAVNFHDSIEIPRLD